VARKSAARGEGAKLEHFGMSPERGFLPEVDPCGPLPKTFAPWEELASELPKRLLTGSLRRAVGSLPLLDPAALHEEGELRRALRLLSFLGHAFVFESDPPAEKIPAALAIPWCAVAARLGRPPILSYASYALDNWRRLERQGPLTLENLALLQNFLGGVDEDWFVTIHVAIEARAGHLLAAALPAQEAVRTGDAARLEALLTTLAEGLEALAAILLRMPERCDPYIYYRRVRPWIHGWKDHPALPHGVVYEGVAEFRGRGQRLRGETGAQSGIVPAVDALLGVGHAADPLRAYLAEMRGYMPPGHRAFLEALEAGPSVREAVRERAHDHPALAEAYDACLHWLEHFRATHLEYAARYIHRQSQSSAANPTDVGTGGTPFMAYLKKHRDETAQHRLR
jgi:indoleamine 2,3-dioxygenase